MFTNTTQAAPVASPSIVSEFVRNTIPKQCDAVLDELFFEWIGSEGSDDTDSAYRATVTHCYRQMKELLSKMELTQEVNHD